MRVIKKTTMDRVFNKLYRDLGIEEISEDDVVEWTGEVLDHIGVITMYDEHVAFIEVNNHRAELPRNLLSIKQIAKNNKFQKNVEETKICIDSIPTPGSQGCSDCEQEGYRNFVPLDCQGRIIGDYEVAYYRPYFDLQYDYVRWSQSELYTNSFTPVRLTNKTFFNNLVCEEDPKMYSGTDDEYTIVDNQLRFNFKDGQVAVAYYSLSVDPETGFPMIPDEVSVIQAITSYIAYKYTQRLWLLGREGYTEKFRTFQQDYEWYINQAKNKLFGPYGIDDFENLLKMQTLIPNTGKYGSFFETNRFNKR